VTRASDGKTLEMRETREYWPSGVLKERKIHDFLSGTLREITYDREGKKLSDSISKIGDHILPGEDDNDDDESSPVEAVDDLSDGEPGWRIFRRAIGEENQEDTSSDADHPGMLSDDVADGEEGAVTEPEADGYPSLAVASKSFSSSGVHSGIMAFDGEKGPDATEGMDKAKAAINADGADPAASKRTEDEVRKANSLIRTLDGHVDVAVDLDSFDENVDDVFLSAKDITLEMKELYSVQKRGFKKVGGITEDDSQGAAEESDSPDFPGARAARSFLTDANGNASVNALSLDLLTSKKIDNNDLVLVEQILKWSGMSGSVMFEEVLYAVEKTRRAFKEVTDIR